MIELINDTRYLNNHREYKEYYNDDKPYDALNVVYVDNGIVLPKSEIYLSKGGVLDAEGVFVPESSVTHEGSFLRIDAGYEYDPAGEMMVDDTVIYLGYFFRHWGHFLMDCTTRMWALIDDRFKGHKVVFPDTPGYVRDGNYSRFLELLGVDDSRIIPVKAPTRFKQIIVPMEARIQPERIHMPQWYDVFDTVAANAVYDPAKVPEKVYFSRSKFGKPELGEDEIEYNFRQNGYSIIYPERLSLDDQIGIFREAREVVSQNSSICMNVVFASPSLKWTVINKYSSVHRNFTELRYAKDLDITYIDAYSDRLDIYGDRIGSLPYLVSFNDNMKRYFADNGMTVDTYGPIYRICNVIRYLFRCVVIRPKKYFARMASKAVRWMKKDAKWLYKLLKRVF